MIDSNMDTASLLVRAGKYARSLHRFTLGVGEGRLSLWCFSGALLCVGVGWLCSVVWFSLFDLVCIIKQFEFIFCFDRSGQLTIVMFVFGLKSNG